ncbi:MAG TPA: response regulator transcription factor [Candidatus Acidoferrum sp.]|nr:response regulator transcription factor [Candidatus Acidoferrum sp.]
MTGLTMESVILADRHHGLTEGVRDLLKSMFATVLMVADEGSLLKGIERIRPNVAVVDLSLFRSGGTQWLARIKAACPQMLLIVLSVYDEETVKNAVLTAGADGFVIKRNIATELLSSIESALHHEHLRNEGPKFQPKN